MYYIYVHTLAIYNFLEFHQNRNKTKDRLSGNGAAGSVVNWPVQLIDDRFYFSVLYIYLPSSMVCKSMGCQFMKKQQLGNLMLYVPQKYVTPRKERVPATHVPALCLFFTADNNLKINI